MSELLERLLSSEVKGELLILFHGNPGLVDTVDAIARRIGRTGAEITEDVKDFISLGIIQQRTIGKTSVVQLNRTRDKEIQKSLGSYLSTLKR